MEKITEIQITRKEHEFYCDNCNEFLGKSTELDDGYYTQYGEFELKVYTNKWHYYKKCLCKNCQKLTTKKFENMLSQFGFESFQN